MVLWGGLRDCGRVFDARWVFNINPTEPCGLGASCVVRCGAVITYRAVTK